MTIRKKIRHIKHLQNKNFICILEDPKDIKNIGTVIRNISAFGVQKLYVISNNNILKDFETSRTNKTLKKLSVGSNKWIFTKSFTTTQECIKHLKKNGYTIATTSSHSKDVQNVNLYETNFTQKKLAIFFGNESKGVSQEAIKNSDMCIQIPMGGIVESLNLGTSTGIILSFVSYQRLKFVFKNKKVHFKNKGLGKLKMDSWEKFLGLNNK